MRLNPSPRPAVRGPLPELQPAPCSWALPGAPSSCPAPSSPGAAPDQPPGAGLRSPRPREPGAVRAPGAPASPHGHRTARRTQASFLLRLRVPGTSRARPTGLTAMTSPRTDGECGVRRGGGVGWAQRSAGPPAPQSVSSEPKEGTGRAPRRRRPAQVRGEARLRPPVSRSVGVSRKHVSLSR